MARGFTLLEILMVIAIVGIVSGVVIAFLLGARNGANDVTIKSNLREIKNLAELYYQDKGQYTNNPCGGNQAASCLGTGVSTVCMHSSMTNFIKDPGSTAVQNRIRDADIASGGVGDGVNRIFCRIDSGSWVVSVKLRSSQTTTYWCVDSSGSNLQRNNNITTSSTQCPSS